MVPSLLYVVWLIAWALARLALLRLAAPSTFPNARDAIESAWGSALLPYLLALATPLDLFALAASAALTYRGLVVVGLGRRDATRCVAWAFGGQIAVEIASWLGRSWFFLLAR